MKQSKVLIYLLLSCLGFYSCKEEQKYDETKIFKLNRYDNISSLDPIFARTQANNWITNLMYNGLVKSGDSMQIVPDIAKTWEISEDGKTYTFILRDDVCFHKSPYFGADSTRVVVASDFVYSFSRLTDSKIGGAGSWVMNNVETYSALNDSVFQIKLRTAFPPFLGLLGMKYCSVVPKELFVNGQEEFSKHPIGTGAFRFQYWEENVKLVLRKNSLYFEKDEQGNSLPYLEAVSITFLPEKHSEFLQLVQGKIDMMADLDPSYKNEILTLNGELNPKYKGNINMQKSPYLSTVYLSFYLDGNKVVDEKLRKAINYGINKENMIKYLMNGLGTPAFGGFIPKGLPGYSPTVGYEYNPKKAIDLVNQYKSENYKLPKITLTTTQEYTDICEYIQAELIKIGIDIDVSIVPGSTMREGKATGKFSFFRANWGADYPDAENFLSLFYSKNFAPEGPNYSHYENNYFDELYLKSFDITNEKERENYYKKMDSIMLQTAPIVPMFYDETLIFLNKNVHNFKMSPIKMLDLTRVYKKN